MTRLLITHVFNAQCSQAWCKILKSTTCKTLYIYHFALITMHAIPRATLLSENFLFLFKSLMSPKKMSQKMFDYRLLSRTAKNPIFSTISFATISFLIYANSIVSNLSITTTFDFKTNEIIEPHETDHNKQEQLAHEFESSTLKPQ